MRIHHLSCGSLCPYGGRLMDGRPGTAHLVCHCLLIETDRHGLVLVDTGFGLDDVRRPIPRLSGLFLETMRIQLDARRTAVRQIEALGFSASDVTHILLTHLDFDHAGGLQDFPRAAVHLLDAEREAALHHRNGFVGRRRYRPMQWGDTRHWHGYRPGGEPWFGFRAVRSLTGLPPEILMVPLAGHTAGHAGIAIDTRDGWLLHAGDAYFFHAEMDPDRPWCTPGLAAYQRLMEVDRRSRLANQARLRALVRQPAARLRLFCAHDATELDAFRDEAAAASRRKSPEWISELVAGPDGRPLPGSLVDKASADSFPASDPPAWQTGRTGGFN